ncbi:MAG: ribulose-phosphate 3-epimerase [Clostridia bacterium]|nr:ribulose-phosphate 3-epimerase [Clostridia bacterium]MDD4376065.1 ribulose-phosphate 3-epimerase [Clostridia bacterium]
MIKILPSVLQAEDIEKFLTLLKEQKIMDIDEIHLDIMDGVFVENTCEHLNEIITVKKYGFKVDVHLMVAEPQKHIIKAVDLGADSVTIHEEIKDLKSILELLKRIKKEKDINIGVSIKPQTDVSVLVPYINDIDIVLLMSVEPGKGGQSFIKNTYSKIAELREMSPKLIIVIDGGVNESNVRKAYELGADKAVVGNYLTKDIKSLESNLKNLKL